MNKIDERAVMENKEEEEEERRHWGKKTIQRNKGSKQEVEEKRNKYKLKKIQTAEQHEWRKKKGRHITTGSEENTKTK